MHKKILGICLALVAFAAFAIAPVMASASPVVTENGVAVAAGSKITATGEESSEFASSFINVSCNDFWMTGTLTKNSGTSIEGTIESASFNNKNAEGKTTDCGSNIGETKITIPGLTNEGGTQHWCVVSNAETGGLGKGEVFPHSCGGTGGEFTFVLNNTPGGTTCRYKKEGAIKVTYTTNTVPATIKLAAAVTFNLEQPSGFLCAATGSLNKLNLTLETDASPFTGLSIS